MKTIVPTYCHYGQLEEAFFESLFGFYAFDRENRRIARGCIPIKGLYIDNNRNVAVRQFLNTKGDYALVLDTDMDFAQDVPYRLLDAAEEGNYPILSALYFNFCMDGEIRPIWCSHFHDEDGGLVMIDDIPEQITKLLAVGMGCCLIRRDVFEAIARVPEYAGDLWTWFGRESLIHKGKPSRWGEDMSFCLRAAKCGFPTYGHPKVEADHWKTVKIGRGLYNMLYGERIKYVHYIPAEGEK